ncbi:hypothetical protein [Acanthamoeba polyphaga mimivirus]|uniref:Uncharacterized protein n=1 Tax=Acanthamoeba polyphaga mimivirus TaxID=212035 RepID=A0A2L2DK62_MIMIV|nr:hypothetical protein [Acanthamoeba polyphaga mimivirus]
MWDILTIIDLLNCVTLDCKNICFYNSKSILQEITCISIDCAIQTDNMNYKLKQD